MPYNNKYNQDLKAIIKLLDEGKINGDDGALEKFKTHISEVINIGRFNIAQWNLNWRNSVYDFGTKFPKVDPIDFLNVITDEKTDKNKDQQEVLDFYYSEIDFNSLPQETCTSRLEGFVAKYPYNPEFRHTLGHFFKRNKDYEKAIDQYKFALDKNENDKIFKDSLFNCYKEYLELLIDNSDYQKGYSICNDLVSKRVFWGNGVLHNYLIGLSERFKDYILLNQKIVDAEVSIKEIVAKETQKGQFKVIEILGFFTAIIAFIFSTVSIGKNFSFNEAIIFNISLGIILLLFVLVINLFFTSKEIKLFDFRILLFVILTLSLLLIVSKFGIPIWLD